MTNFKALHKVSISRCSWIISGLRWYISRLIDPSNERWGLYRCLKATTSSSLISIRIESFFPIGRKKNNTSEALQRSNLLLGVFVAKLRILHMPNKSKYLFVIFILPCFFERENRKCSLQFHIDFASFSLCASSSAPFDQNELCMKHYLSPLYVEHIKNVTQVSNYLPT